MITWRKFKSHKLVKLALLIGMKSETESNAFLVHCHFKNAPSPTYVSQAKLIKHKYPGTEEVNFTVMVYTLQGSLNITHYSKINKPIIKVNKYEANPIPKPKLSFHKA